MNSLIVNLLSRLPKRRKWQLFCLFLLMLISTCAEVISIGAIFPFIAMLSAPEKLYYYPLFKIFNVIFQIHSPTELIFPVTVLFILIVIFTGILRTTLLWFTNRLTSACGSELSAEVLKHILYKPYISHISENSSEIIATISHKVNNVVFGVIFPFFTLINSVVLLLAVLVALILIQPVVATATFIILGISYISIAGYVRVKVKKVSQIAATNQAKILKILQESLGGIRDMILDGNQDLYLKIFQDADVPMRKSTTTYNFINFFPRYAMETIGIVLMAVLAFYMSGDKSSIQKILPVLGTLGIGFQRILPVIQQIYSNWVSIESNHIQLRDVTNILSSRLYGNEPNTTRINFSKKIEISGLYFRYNEHASYILEDVTFSIPKGSRIGFIGSTGAGKSTLLDIIMGLLVPNRGQIIIDDTILTDERYRSWQSNVAHVPQSIFLSDASIAENIAFGIPIELIDHNRVHYVAKLALVDEFVQKYPNQYNTVVGERGINLSGGQRQRIGIARALYKNATVLVFDEATSALDTKTEDEIMTSITSFNRSITLLIIAHRLSSLKGCDFVIEIKNGKLYQKELYQVLNN